MAHILTDENDVWRLYPADVPPGTIAYVIEGNCLTKTLRIIRMTTRLQERTVEYVDKMYPIPSLNPWRYLTIDLSDLPPMPMSTVPTVGTADPSAAFPSLERPLVGSRSPVRASRLRRRHKV